ncbi:MAG: hypothetical protein IPJ34_16760 [Myxococcales bacterium]|nr:hypothetical protein [Myxococcales bacterium]MBL8722000.1 hypothetical protein [Myxococcales bacterium]
MNVNRVFFPQALLDEWTADERVELTGDQLVLRGEGRRYLISEAVHVLRDAAGGGDRAGLVGKVKTHEQLAELSAEVFEGSMIIGEEAYDVMPGFVGEPMGAPEPSKPTASVNEEDLLAQFLLQKL